MEQKYTSAATSINSTKVPAVFSKVNWESGTTNLDIGGGRFDTATEFLLKRNVRNLIYDPYNRLKRHNDYVVTEINKQKADTVTLSNVLNVIQEREVRLEVLRNAYDSLKAGGTCYITVYEGNKSGVGNPTTKGYQLNRRLKDYIPEVLEVFETAEIKRNMIIAEK